MWWLTACLLMITGCRQQEYMEQRNAVYYWRTTLRLSAAERQFLDDYKIEKVYCRYFDVVMDDDTQMPRPNATIAFGSDERQLPAHVEIVPTVYITEDSLVARQLNNGSWINGYRHNGVFRCALGSVKGVELNRVEGGYSNEFTMTIPEEWNIANLNVVAFISRPLAAGGGQVFTDLAINNAETARLINQAEGVEELLLSGDVVPVEYYDIMGRKHDSMQPGINIVKMSDGSARKVLVK